MSTGVIIMLAVWVTTILGWVVFNLYNKNKKLETLVYKQNDFAYEMIELMKELDIAVERIDSKVWVSADSELSSLFDAVKNAQERIKRYTETK